MKYQARIRTLVAAAAITIGVGIAPDVADAHHPLVSGVAACRTGDTWNVTWTARADADRNLTWRIVSPDGYSPAGSQADELPFTRTATYPATQASASETVTARWSNQVQDTRTSAPVARPPVCDTPTTTTTTTTVAPTTTTTTPPTTTVPDEPTTTTTVVAVGEPPVPPEQPPTAQPEPVDPAPTPTTVAATSTGGALPATGATHTITLLAAAAALIVIGRRLTRIAR